MKTILTCEVGLLFFSLKGKPPASLSRLPLLLPPTVVAVLFLLLDAVLGLAICKLEESSVENIYYDKLIARDDISN